MIIVATDIEVKLGSPAKSPLLIDVMVLSDKYLCTMHEMNEKHCQNSVLNQVPAKLALLHAGTAVNTLYVQDGKHVGHATPQNLQT